MINQTQSLPTMNFKTIGKSLLIAIASYAVLLGVFEYGGLDSAYEKQLLRFANRFHHKYTDDGRVDFTQTRQLSKGKVMTDFVLVSIQSQKVVRMMEAEARKRNITKIEVPRAQYLLEIWELAITPLILLLVLILASPVNWRRKLWAVGIGLILYHAFLYFKFWVRHSVEVNRHPWLEISTQPEWLQTLLLHINTYMYFIGTSLIVVLVIWVFSTFRGDDLKKLGDFFRQFEQSKKSV